MVGRSHPTAPLSQLGASESLLPLPLFPAKALRFPGCFQNRSLPLGGECGLRWGGLRDPQQSPPPSLRLLPPHALDLSSVK